MAGIYLHIPFCKQACHYCDFHFSTSLRYKKEMLDAMHAELELQHSYLGELPVKTIYFGGGTPSLLTSDEISAFIDHISDIFTLSPGAEITLEANPDDLGAERVKALGATPVNRFSIGVQSFFEEDLRWMNRVHSVAEAESSVKRIQDAGFENITLDLIYGYPLLSDEKWKANIEKVRGLGIPHISAYSMTVEPQTALASFIRKGVQKAMNDSQSVSQFAILMNSLNDAGFEHYEISNFALPEMYSRHNSNYWKGVPYLGIGPSAHSFNTESRQWNIANNAKYLQSLAEKKIPSEIEITSTANKINEYIMTSIRTMWGMDLEKIARDFGEDYRNQIEGSLKKIVADGRAKSDAHIVTLTTEGKFFADQVAAELFVD